MIATLSGRPIGASGPITIHVDSGRIEAVTPGGDPEVLLAPGLVDIHCHGGGGHEFGTGGTTEAAAAHHATGTTSVIASLVSAPLAVLLDRVKILLPGVSDGTIAGIHLEGPFLAPQHAGAHDPAALSLPDLEAAIALVECAQGAIRMLTLAPELEGAPDLIHELTKRGVVPAFGHTAASAQIMSASIEATVDQGVMPIITHLYNGMPPVHHRSPGPAFAALEAAAQGRAFVELITDGVHLGPEMIRGTFQLVGRSVILVSDSTPATGLGDGAYHLGNVDVVVSNGESRALHGGTIAGSVTSLAQCVRNTIGIGVDPSDAFVAATSRPAASLGLSEVGSLTVGKRADVLVLTSDWELLSVWKAGKKLEV